MTRLSLPKLFLVLLGVFALTQFSQYLFQRVLPAQFSQQWQPTTESLAQNGQYDPSDEIGEFEGTRVQSANIQDNPALQETVLGSSDGSNKRIEVDLSTQMVYAFEGDTRVMIFLISSGKWGKTPTGTFNIAYKTKAQKMSGGSRALGTYYYLPNVQFVQFFGNSEIPWSRGFSFHGTYWHNNFGTPMSHGCINMRNEDAEKLFYWTDPTMGDSRTVRALKDEPGTPVIIYGTPPKS
jgi:lipoprotein-anchoring transpeptidase ErfK/SrfK